MDENQTRTEAVEQLQALGLKEYESEALVTLIQLGTGTAKDVSENSEVPRTRVYDAVRVLEAKGLVEVQHSSPQQFRPVPVSEALSTLENQYEARFASLESTLQGLEGTGTDVQELVNEVWTLNDSEAIANRILRLVEEADSEVIIVVGTGELFDTEQAERLEAAADRGVTVVVGILDGSVHDRVREAVPSAEVFTTGLEWLEPSADVDEASIGQIALVDRRKILVSSIDAAETKERAVFATGVTNGFVVISRRLLLTGKAGELLTGER